MTVTAQSIRAAAALFADNVNDTPCLYSRTLLEILVVPADSIIIHGELDETVPLANVLAWARPQALPVIVVPGADHFFHRRLHLIKSIIKGSWQR